MTDEDRSQVRCGNTQVMAALRNTTIGLLRWQAIRILQQRASVGGQPVQALALIGIEMDLGIYTAHG